MSKDIKRLTDLQEELQQERDNLLKVNTTLKTVKKDMKEHFGVSKVADAEALLKKMESEIEELQDSIDASIKTLEDDFDIVLDADED